MRLERAVLGLTLLALAAPAWPQEACPSSAAEQRRIALEVMQSARAREVVAEGRTRVLHSYCSERDKDSRREVLTSIVYNYATNVPVRLVVDPASRQLIAADRINRRPQTSAEEREEAFRLVRDTLHLGAEGVLEGGFAVDPPAEANARPGRYVQVQVLSPDRWKLLEFVTVDLSRGVVVSRRQR